MQLYPKLITDALATVMYAGTKKNLIESEMLADQPKIDGMKVEVILVFPKETDPFMASTIKAAEAAIHYHVSKDVEVPVARSEEYHCCQQWQGWSRKKYCFSKSRYLAGTIRI